MAVNDREVAVLGPGTKVTGPVKGTYVQNMLYRRESWETRDGFGQVAQLATSLASPIRQAGIDNGILEHLGSTIILTDFGHRQVVSVFRAQVHTGNEDDTYATAFTTVSAVTQVYTVFVYDLQTDRYWETPLYRHTSENNDDIQSLDQWRSHYETSMDEDRQNWRHATAGDTFFFHEYRDILFLGSPRAGLWAYRPTMFDAPRYKQVDGVHDHEWGSVYGDGSPLTPVVPVDGQGTDAYVYFNQSEVGPVYDVAHIAGRLVWAQARGLLLSDVGQPANIIADNFVEIPSERDITAIAEHNGVLLIWTSAETWMYRLSSGEVASLGRLDRLSDSIGCLGPNAVTMVGERLAWVDVNGVYAMGDALTIDRISGDIDPFFTDFITSPISSFYAQNGFTPTTLNQPNTVLRLDPANVNVSWSGRQRVLLITVPNENLSLCMSAGGRWSVWTYTSNVAVSGGQSFAGTTQNIDHPWLVADEQELLLVGSVDEQTLVDTAQRAGVDIDDDITARSYYLLRYGRGGSIDRSTETLAAAQPALEDKRRLLGRYTKTIVAGADPGACYIDEWIEVPVGYTFPNGSTVTAPGSVFLLPISVVLGESFIRTPTTTAGPDRLNIHFRFDNGNWTVARKGATTEIDFILPSERMASAGGYSPGGPIAGTAEVQLYDTGTGLPSTTGDQVRINWNGATSAVTWQHHPRMNLTASRKEPVIYIPMVKTTSNETSAMGLVRVTAFAQELGVAPIPATAATPGAVISQLQFYAWEQWNLEAISKDDTNAQPIDWAYKTDNVSDEEGARLKARGLFIRLLGRGRADDVLESNWLYGLLNTIAGSDWKQWQAQIVDYAGTAANNPAIDEVRSKNSIITRLFGLTSVFRTKVFGAPAPNRLTYGDVTVAATGNTLITDEETSEIATSDSVKGHSFSYMLHGNLQNKAEKLVMSSVKATFRVIGGRRRRGH